MTYRLGIIGAGVSGLAAAQRALELGRETGSDVAVTLLEARARLGGAVGTLVRDGYRVELGADMFITDKPWGVALCERLGLGARLIGANPAFRRSLILSRGVPTPVPEGFMLMAPTELASVLATPILSPAGKLRLCAERFLPARRDDADESLAAFVRRRLGREALDRLVEPLVAGIYTGDPERLSLRATLPRFPAMEREYGSLWRGQRAVLAKSARAKPKTEGGGNPGERATGRHTSVGTGAGAGATGSGARYGLFVSFPRGMVELFEALEQAIRAGGAAIELGANVCAIERAGAGFTVDYERAPASVDGAAEAPRAAWTDAPPRGTEHVRRHFDGLVVALPAPRASTLLASVSPALAAELGRIRYASSAIVVSGHRLADIRHPLDAFGLVVPAIEGRQVFSVSFASRKFPDRAPEGRVLLRSFVGGLRQEELLARSDEALCALVRRELASMLGVGGQPDFELVARHERAMPQYELGHLERVAAIERLLAHEPALALASNAFFGVGVPDCVHSGERAAEKLCTRERERP